VAHVSILWLCALVVVGVFAVMIHSIATFRRAVEPGARADRQQRAWAEIIWAIVPIFIMVSTALPAVRMLAAPDAPSIAQAHAEPLHKGRLFSTAAASYNADRK
jgi:heme/copper-type cytochrome/quinol oxidase subunit 2